MGAKRCVVIGLCLVVVTSICAIGHLFFRAQKNSSFTAPVDTYRFISTPCWFDVPWQEDIRCGELHTPATTGKFSLPVVIIRDNSVDHQPDPVVYLQGGPGASADLNTEGIEQWLHWRTYMGLGRDLVLLDPRGVGRSRPALACEDYDKFSLAVLSRNSRLIDELAEGYKVLQKCFDDLRMNSPAFAMKHYGTRLHAKDVTELMSLLEYPQWNILAVSYGTRVAIEAANQSKQVRSLILDSVYPAQHGGTHSFPRVLDTAVINFFRWCDSAHQCDGVNVQDFLQALTRLKKAPLTLTVARRNGEVPVELVVNDHRFVSAVFSALYSKHLWPRISQAIIAVNGGHEAGLMPLIEPFINNALADGFNALAFMAVDCNDHPLTAEDDYQEEVKKYPLLADYTRDLWRFQSCHFLSVSGLSNAPRQIIPHVPALILAGDLDPITPLQWAQELHQQWPGSQLKVVADTGHAVINSDDCVFTLLRSFLDSPQQIVTGCGAETETESREDKD